MVNRYSSIMLPYFGLISEGYIKEFIQQLEKFMNADGKILTSSITSTYATNRLAANIGLNNTDSQTGLLDSVYAAAWNKLKEISPQDTELKFLPPRFNSFYRIDRVFDLLIIVNSDCLYQLLVQNIPTDLISSYCSNGEIDNFYSNSQSIFITYTFNATYSCPNPGPLESYTYASCGALYPNNCTTPATTTTTSNPALFTKKTLRVAVVLTDSFAMRDPTSRVGYSGYAVDLVKLVGAQLHASLSFAEVSLPNLTGANDSIAANEEFTFNDLECASLYECQWDLLVYNLFYNSSSADIIIGFIPLTNAFANDTISIGFVGGEIQTGISILIR